MAGGWELYHNTDAPAEEHQQPGRHLSAATEEELESLKADCLSLGFSGFVVKQGRATYRAQPRAELLQKRNSGWWPARGNKLYVAPAPGDAVDFLLAVPQEGLAASQGCSSSSSSTGRPGLTEVVFGSCCFRADPQLLVSRSGYFESAFRHDWGDAARSSARHSFQEFPGGELAFTIALRWLSTPPTSATGPPWPIQDLEQANLGLEGAAYLDSPLLARALTLSWHLAAKRSREDLLKMAGVLSIHLSSFNPEGQQLLIKELRFMLEELPKHQLALSTEFLASPTAGLAVLDARDAARESIVGHIKNVGGWVNAVLSGDTSITYHEDSPIRGPHDFAVRLLDRHEGFFLQRLPVLRRLLRHVEPSTPIAVPLAFRVAAACIAAEVEGDSEVFAGQRIALDVVETSVAHAPDPAQAASEEACVVSLFGAGGNAPLINLDILARPGFPPAAGGVVLSRVLSSWAAGEGRESTGDPADIILDGVVKDRQRLRSLLLATVHRLGAEEAGDAERRHDGAEWGTLGDLAVPELVSAFSLAVTKALQRAATESETGRMPEVFVGEAQVDETLRLLFKLLFRATGGLPGVHFPLALLADLRGHTAAGLGIRRALQELHLLKGDEQRTWREAEAVWPLLAWDGAEVAQLTEAVRLVREWLTAAKASDHFVKREAKAAAVRLLARMALHKLSEPEDLLGPPIPAHVIALLVLRRQEQSAARIEALEAENSVLRTEIDRLTLTQRAGPGS